jgi:FK506-binding protein 2
MDETRTLDLDPRFRRKIIGYDGVDDQSESLEYGARPKADLGSFQRREFLFRSVLTSLIAGIVMDASAVESTTAATPLNFGTSQTLSAITDETDTFSDNWWTSPSSSGNTRVPRQTSTTPTDEVVVKVRKNELVNSGGLGIELSDAEYQTNRRVYVKSVQAGSLAERLGIRPDWVFVAINDESTERTDAEGVTRIVSRALSQSTSDNNMLIFRFRNPNAFRQQLNSFPTGTAPNEGDAPGTTVSTRVAPAGDTTRRNADGSVQVGRSVTSQSDQEVTVTQLVAPSKCTRGATSDDLVEISYVGTIAGTGVVFDGSTVMIDGRGIPGRGNDVSIYFVLGKQPFGQFPPGWDVGLQGICVGERRRLIIPPVLAYGREGIPRRGIPPNATLQYDVTLLSLNGLSTPQ